MTLPSLEEYMASLTNVAVAADPTVLTAEGAVIGAAAAIASLPEVTRADVEAAARRLGLL